MQRHTCWCRRTEFGKVCADLLWHHSSGLPCLPCFPELQLLVPPENLKKPRDEADEPLIGSIGWMFSCRDQCLDEALRPVQAAVGLVWRCLQAGKMESRESHSFVERFPPENHGRHGHGRHGTRMKSTHDMLNIGRPETSLRPKCVSWHLDSQLCRHLRSAYLCIVRLKDSFTTLGLWPGCKRCQRRSKCRSRWIWYNLD